VDLDVVGNPSRTAPRDLPCRAQIDDVGDPQLQQRRPALVFEAAQLAGPKQLPRPQSRGAVGDITKVPRAR
jgi:hypothetical protein